MAMGRAATKLYILYSHPTSSRAAGLNWSAWAARRPPARVGKGQRGKARGMRGMPTHLDHREALLPSGLPLAVVGHLLPKVFPALRNQRLDDLLPLLRPCASARRFRGLDTRGFARGARGWYLGGTPPESGRGRSPAAPPAAPARSLRPASPPRASTPGPAESQTCERTARVERSAHGRRRGPHLPQPQDLLKRRQALGVGQYTRECRAACDRGGDHVRPGREGGRARGHWRVGELPKPRHLFGEV